MKQLRWMLAGFLCVMALPAARAQTPDSGGQVPAPSTLAALVRECKQIVLLEVVEVSADDGIILFQQTSDLKAKAVTTPAKVSAVAVSGLTDVLRWAEPGRQAVAFDIGGFRVVCVGNCWFQATTLVTGGSDRAMTESPIWEGPLDSSRHDWGTTYVGRVDRLIRHVQDLQAGREVVVTARAPSHRDNLEERAPPHLRLDWLRGRKGKLCRLKVSPNLLRPPEIVGRDLGGAEIVPGQVRALRHPSALVRAEAAENLGQLGPLAQEAVISLRERLKDADPHVRIFAAEALARIQPREPVAIDVLCAGLKHTDAAVRSTAIGALASLEVRAQTAVPTLLAILENDKDYTLREMAAYALGEIGPEATFHGCDAAAIVPALVRALLADDTGALDRWASKALYQFGPATRPALPTLRKALNPHTSGGVLAAGVLCRMGPAGVAAVVEASADDDVDANSLIWLGYLGHRGRSTLPTLMGALKDKELTTRKYAAQALLNIDRKLAAPAVLPVFIQLVNEQDQHDMRVYYLWGLGRLGPEAQPAVPILRKYLEQEPQESPWRGRLVHALGNIGPRAKVALPALKAAMADPDLDMRFAAANAVWQVTRDKTGIIPVVRACLSNPESPSWMHRDGVKLLQELGGVDEPLVSALAGLLKDKQNDDARQGVLCSLAELGALAKSARPAVQRFIRQEKKPSLRQAAILTLATIDPGNEEAHAALKAAFENQDDEVRLETVRALPDDGRARPPRELTALVVPLLARALADVNLDVRVGAAEALARLGGDAKPAVAALVTALKDLNPPLRLAVLTALFRIEPQHPEIVPAVAAILAETPGYFQVLQPILAELGPRARPAVPVLLRIYRTRELEEGMSVLDLLDKIDPESAARLWPEPETGSAGFTTRQFEALWTDLGSGNTPRGYRAYWKIVLAPRPPVQLFKERLPPVPRAEPDQIARWIADLDNDRFQVREKATQALERVEQLAEPALRRALAGQPPLEVQQRLDRLLDKLDPAKSGQLQCALWSVEILERIGSPSAREVLTSLAGGAAEARLTSDAQAALKRLTALPEKKP